MLAPLRRQRVRTRRLTGFTDELVEARRRADRQPARSLGLHAIHMRNAARGEERVARLELHRRVRRVQRQATVQHVERFVVTVVHVQRRHVAAAPRQLDDGQRASARLAVDVHAGQVVDEPDRLGLRVDRARSLTR